MCGRIFTLFFPLIYLGQAQPKAFHVLFWRVLSTSSPSIYLTQISVFHSRSRKSKNPIETEEKWRMKNLFQGPIRLGHGNRITLLTLTLKQVIVSISSLFWLVKWLSSLWFVSLILIIFYFLVKFCEFVFLLGMEKVDKEKVQRVVYEMSKGSKYFENEEKKEAYMKQKIENMRVQWSKLTASDLNHFQKVHFKGRKML